VVDVSGADIDHAAEGCVVALSGPPASAAVSFSCPGGSVAPGAGFSCGLSIATGTAVLGAYDLTLAFDVRVISMSSVTGGSASGFTMEPGHASSGSAPGELRLVGFNRSQPMEQAGGGIVAGVGFTAGNAGGLSTRLAVRLTTLADAAGGDITAAAQCGEIQLTGTPIIPFDVDRNGPPVDQFTDLVYVARRLFNLPPVPPSFRMLDPNIDADQVIAARVDAIDAALDVDADGVVDPFTDVVYCARRLFNLPPVPPSFRALDASIPPDSIINRHCGELDEG
jgi:hypothetical protein